VASLRSAPFFADDDERIGSIYVRRDRDAYDRPQADAVGPQRASPSLEHSASRTSTGDHSSRGVLCIDRRPAHPVLFLFLVVVYIIGGRLGDG